MHYQQALRQQREDGEAATSTRYIPFALLHLAFLSRRITRLYNLRTRTAEQNAELAQLIELHVQMR